MLSLYYIVHYNTACVCISLHVLYVIILMFFLIVLHCSEGIAAVKEIAENMKGQLPTEEDQFTQSISSRQHYFMDREKVTVPLMYSFLPFSSLPLFSLSLSLPSSSLPPSLSS